MDRASNDISVIDTAINTVIATVGGGGCPIAVAITPDGSRAYVGNNCTTSVSVINTATNTVVATIAGVGAFPGGVAITSDGTRAYVTNEFTNDVSVIDTASNTVVATVAVGNNPIGVAITPTATSVPFAAFVPQAAIDLDANAFAVIGKFTLGTGSDGIAPLTEPVQLKLGTFSTTIPAGSFKKNGGGFTFSGVINGVKLDMLIQPTGKGKYFFAVLGRGANLVGTANPVIVGLTIGNDTGSASITAFFE